MVTKINLFLGATENAIQKKPVDITDLPPPLFCRPRKSPKTNLDSKQPSISCITNFGASDNRSILCESRRQSTNATILESNNIQCSLSDKLQANETSPFIAKHRKLDTTPLYLNEDFGYSIPEKVGSSERLDALETELNTKRPLAKVRPRQMIQKIDMEDTGGSLPSHASSLSTFEQSTSPFPKSNF